MLPVYHGVILLTNNGPCFLFVSKRCNTCHKDKIYDEFNESPQQKDGHAGRCRQCEHDKRANRTEEEKEHDSTIRRASEDSRREQIRAYDRERGKLPHRKADKSARQKAKLAEARAQRELELQLNPPPPKLTKICPKCDPPVEKPLSEFYANSRTKDKHCVYCIECTKKDAHERVDAIRERERRKKQEQPGYLETINERTKHWRRTSPIAKLSMQETVMRRNARKKQARVGRVSYKRVLARDGNMCYLCGLPILPTDKLHFDHVIPLAKGGPHTEDNIRPTHARCNRQKGARLLPSID